MKRIGTVTRWLGDGKNYGFIVLKDENSELVTLFFHRKHVIHGEPAEGQIARFDAVRESSGLVAHNVEILPCEHAAVINALTEAVGS